MNDREFIESIQSQCAAHLGGSTGGGGGTLPPKPDAMSVTTKPPTIGDHATGNGPALITGVSVNAPFGFSFTIVAGATNERKIRWEGHPGQFWDHNSWTIFDSGGGVALSADNQVVAGTLGYTLGNDVLMQLGAGTYSIGIAVNGAGTLATFFIQN